MNDDGIIYKDADNLCIPGLDTLIKLTRYSPVQPTNFLDGLELAEDIRTSSGSVLYPKDIELTKDRIGKLHQLRESNNNLDFSFKIKLNETLFERFRFELRERIKYLLKRRREIKIFKDLMSGIAGRLEPLFEKILADNTSTFELYKVRFLCEKIAKSRRASLFADHLLNVSILSLAIAISHKFKSIIGEDEGKLVTIMKAGLFHNFGALYAIDNVLETPEPDRPKAYWEAIHNGFRDNPLLKLGREVEEAMEKVYLYNTGKLDVITNDQWPEVMTNILIVADLFLQKEGGFFGEPMEARDVVDQLNIKVMDKQINSLAVQALTLGLNLIEIFDFYTEIDDMIGKCPYDSAVPYPLTGLCTPTIFVCKKTVTECRYLEQSIKAVKLVKRLGKLLPGDYNRCKLLSPKLLAFYDEYYEAIKESTAEKAKSATPPQKEKAGTDPGKPAQSKDSLAEVLENLIAKKDDKEQKESGQTGGEVPDKQPAAEKGAAQPEPEKQADAVKEGTGPEAEKKSSKDEKNPPEAGKKT
jgi:hypothetical protein